MNYAHRTLPYSTLATARLPDGAELVLQQDGAHFYLFSGGSILMSSRHNQSEQNLGVIACDRIPATDNIQVLIGGLGMGITLRAVLDRLPSTATVTVAEVSVDIVEWNRSILSNLAQSPLLDPRVIVRQEDVTNLLGQNKQYDAVVLDTDNSVGALSMTTNSALYTQSGILRIKRLLTPMGVLAIWFLKGDSAFFRRLEQAGLSVELHLQPSGENSTNQHLVVTAHQKTPSH